VRLFGRPTNDVTFGIFVGTENDLLRNADGSVVRFDTLEKAKKALEEFQGS
jgi:hypothetical protein